MAESMFWFVVKPTALLLTAGDAGKPRNSAERDKSVRGESGKQGAAAALLPSSLPVIEEILAKTYPTTAPTTLTEAANCDARPVDAGPGMEPERC